MAIMSPQGYNDYVAALGAVQGYSLTARQSAGTYRAASISLGSPKLGFEQPLLHTVKHTRHREDLIVVVIKLEMIY